MTLSAGHNGRRRRRRRRRRRTPDIKVPILDINYPANIARESLSFDGCASCEVAETMQLTAEKMRRRPMRYLFCKGSFL